MYRQRSTSLQVLAAVAGVPSSDMRVGLRHVVAVATIAASMVALLACQGPSTPDAADPAGDEAYPGHVHGSPPPPPAPLRDGERFVDGRAGSAVPAGAAARWHRRVPLLPDRPEAERGVVHHRQPVPAPERRDRPPRDHVRDRTVRCGPCQERGRRNRRRWLAVLRRHRALQRLRGLRRRRSGGTFIGGWAPGGKETPGCRYRRVPGRARQPDRAAGALQPVVDRRAAGPARPVLATAAGHAGYGRRDAAVGAAAAGTDRAAVHAAGVGSTLRSGQGDRRPRRPYRLAGADLGRRAQPALQPRQPAGCWAPPSTATFRSVGMPSCTRSRRTCICWAVPSRWS